MHAVNEMPKTTVIKCLKNLQKVYFCFAYNRRINRMIWNGRDRMRESVILQIQCKNFSLNLMNSHDSVQSVQISFDFQPSINQQLDQ